MTQERKLCSWAIVNYMKMMSRDGQGSTQATFKEFGLCLLEKKYMVFPVVMCRYESWTMKKAEL